MILKTLVIIALVIVFVWILIGMSFVAAAMERAKDSPTDEGVGR